MGSALKGLATQDLMEVLMVSRTALECRTVDELISETLRQLEGIFKSGNSTFFFARHLAQTLNLDRVITRGIDDSFLTEFRKYYHKQDPFILRGLPLAPKSVLTTEQIISSRDLVRSEYYNDFLKPQAIRFQMSIFLRSEQRLLGILSLFRPQGARRFSTLDISKANLMASYLAGALKKAMVSRKMDERESFIDSIVDRLPCKGVMVLDTYLEPIYQDQSAAMIMSELNGGTRHEDAPSQPVPEEIYLQCGNLMDSIECGQNPEPLRYHFHLVTPGRNCKVSVHLRLLVRPGKSPLMLVILDPAEQLCSLFPPTTNHGLTKRETEVTSLLSKGLTNKGIAEKLFISEYTVENHLRSIYRKMGVKNRTSLVHKLIQMNYNDDFF